MRATYITSPRADIFFIIGYHRRALNVILRLFISRTDTRDPGSIAIYSIPGVRMDQRFLSCSHFEVVHKVSVMRIG